MLDGADCNRQFIRLHFKDKDPDERKFVYRNIYTGDPIIFIMDPKVLKVPYLSYAALIKFS